MRDVRVASVQMESAAGDKEANFAKLERVAREAAGGNVAMAVFPECCLTGYWFLRHLTVPQLAQLAEPVPDGPSCARLLALSARHGLSLGAGLVESASEDVFHNTYVVAMPDGRLVSHRKLHAFEHPAIQPGDEHTVFDTPHGFRAALLVCYDNNIVENVRIAALRGAEVLLAPHQTGGCRTTNPHLMGAIDRRLWDERESNPEAIERELRGRKAGRGSCAGCRAARTTTASSWCSATAWASTTTRSGPGTRRSSTPMAASWPRAGRQGTTWSSRISTPRSSRRPPGASGCRRAAPASTASSRVPTGRERDAHQLKFEE